MSLPDSSSAKTPARGMYVEKPAANIYTALLVLSFVALVIGCLCLAGEMSTYQWDFKAAGAKLPA